MEGWCGQIQAGPGLLIQVGPAFTTAQLAHGAVVQSHRLGDLEWSPASTMLAQHLAHDLLSQRHIAAVVGLLQVGGIAQVAEPVVSNVAVDVINGVLRIAPRHPLPDHAVQVEVAEPVNCQLGVSGVGSQRSQARSSP